MKDEQPPNWKWLIKRMLVIFLLLYIMALIRGYFREEPKTLEQKLSPEFKAEMKQSVDKALDEFRAQQEAADRKKMDEAMRKYLEEKKAKEKKTP